MCRSLVILLWLVLVPFFCSADETKDKPFELLNGDRVLFLGGSFFERALEYGHLETALALRFPDQDISFRNIGWDGDTVFGHSRTGGRRRAVFGDAEEGFQRMVEHVRSLKPSVIFLAYGSNESFEGLKGVTHFKKGLHRLIKELGNGRKVRFVFLSPLPVIPKFLPKPSYYKDRHAALMAYTEALRSVAAETQHPFVDLIRPLANTEFTKNGLHPHSLGYRLIASQIAHQLNLPSSRVKLTSTKAETLRASIIKKNVLYFHRWRPRNDAFVYGERKDEQKIAQTEPAQFESFIVKEETNIRNLLKSIASNAP